MSRTLDPSGSHHPHGLSGGHPGADDQGHDHDHHHHRGGLLGAVREVFAPHSHDHTDSVDDALESSAQGIRAVKISLLALGVTAIFQLVIVALSASAALVADGLHARTDGFTSLAVVFGAVGVWLGFPLADPIIGLLITAAILVVLRTAARDVFARLLDGVDPDLVDAAEQALAAEPGVRSVRRLRMRWIGHRLHADAELDIDPDTSLTDAHRIAHDAEHILTHAVPKLSSALVHAYPATAQARE